MAVATGREYGSSSTASPRSRLPASRELIEPATGEPLATVALASEADVDRAVEPRARRSTATGARRRRPSARGSCTRSPTRSSRTARSWPSSRRATSARRSRRSRPSSPRRSRTSASTPPRSRSIAGRSNPIGGSLLFYSLKEPVGVCRPDRAVELPADDDDVEARAGARGGLHGRPQARLADAADGAAAGGARDARSASRRARSTSSPAPGPTIGALPRAASRRRQGRVHRLDEDGRARSCGSRPTRSSASRSSSAARARTSSSPTPISTTRSRARSGRSTTRPARAARRARACSSRSSIYDDFVAQFAEARGELKVGDPLDPETQIGSLISTEHRDRVHGFVERGRDEGAEVVTGGEPADGKGAFYPPTVLAQVDNSMTVAQEEIFGPVVTVIPFEDEKDAVRLANDVALRADGDGLDAATPRAATGSRARIKAGTVGINMPYTAFPGHPVRRLQAVRLRPRARARDARALPRDEERDRLDEPEADQPVRAVARRSATAGSCSPPARRRRRASPRSCWACPVLAPALRERIRPGADRGRHRPRERLGRAHADAAAVGPRSPTGSASGSCWPCGLAAAACSSCGGAVRLLVRGSWFCSRLAARPGASVKSASGRAVMQWFPAGERGLALGVRPDGDPGRRADRGARAACRSRASARRSSSSAGSALTGAIGGAVVIRETPRRGACSSRVGSSGRCATGASGLLRREAVCT